jgi:predicted glycosyltransferase
MRVWIDATAPAHPVIFRPIIHALRRRGHEVEVTARAYAQTLPLLERYGIEYASFGAHGGSGRLRKGAALATRTHALRRWAHSRRFDLAIAHGSNDLALTAASLHVPAVNMFDYEFAIQQHNIGCRLARRVLTPDAIPPQRLERFGVTRERLRQFPGLKEEYYLADFVPDRAVLDELDLDSEAVLVVVRPPPDVSLYHRRANPLFPQLLAHLGHQRDVRAVVVPRTERQRTYVRALGFPSLVVPERAIDAQSLIALADLVVSAGGTMNREAVALGTPVYTTFGGRLGGVDEELIRSGRLRPLTDARALELVKYAGARAIHRRDPEDLVDLMLEAVA